MKSLAKYHACNHCVMAKKHLKIYLSGPISYRGFRETGPAQQVSLVMFLNRNQFLLPLNTKI